MVIILFTLSYIPYLSFKKKFIRAIEEYDTITDVEISKRLMRPLDKIKEKMYILSKNQKRKKWLITFLSNRYIFYNSDTIQKFNELYDKGYGEKQILRRLQKDFNVKTRAEIKVIKDTLIDFNRIKKRDISARI
jgi:hypothetical protein